MGLEETFPATGNLTVEWTVSEVDGRRRMSWTFTSNPNIDRRLAVALLRDVSDELEMDLPDPSGSEPT
jgi:hypothetical protein